MHVIDSGTWTPAMTGRTPAARPCTHPHAIIVFLLWVLAGPMSAAWSAEPMKEAAPARPSGAESSETPKATGSFLGYKAAIQVSLDNHPQLKRSEQALGATTALTELAKARYYPQIDLYAIQTIGTIRPLSKFNIAGAQNKPTSYVEEMGVLADQLIYDFGKTAHTVLAEKSGRDAAEKELLTNKAVVIMRAQQTYIRCLRQKRLVEIAQETVRERGVIRDQVSLLFQRQLKSKLDFDLISVELRNAEVALIEAKNELRAAFAELNNAMGVRGPEEYTLEEVSTEAPSGSLESLIQGALVDRPELLGNKDRIRQAEEKLTVAQSAYLPVISALGMSGIIHFSDSPRNQCGACHVGYTLPWWGAAATVTVPLFTGFLIENRVAEAREQKYKEEQKQVDLSNRVALEVTDAYLTLQTAEQQVKVAEKEVEASKSALTLAKERYRLGLASIVDVTTATTLLLTAEVRLSNARYAVQASAVAIAYAIGKVHHQF